MNRHIEQATKKKLSKKEDDKLESFVIDGIRYPLKYDIDHTHKKWLSYFDLMDTLETKTDAVSAQQLQRMREMYGTREEYLLKITLIVSEYDTVDAHDGERKKKLIGDFFKALGQEVPVFQLESVNTTDCGECGGNLIPLPPEDALTCEDCGLSVTYAENNINHFTYKQRNETEFKTKYSYDRLSHFTDKLAQMQGKERTNVPQEVFDKIRAEIRKENIPENFMMTKPFMVKMMKRANLSQWYEHSWYIIKVLYPHCKPLQLTNQAEETLKEMFKAIEAPFEKHKHLMRETVSMSARKSFLNYDYVLRKCFEILKMPELAELCPLRKNQAKVKTYDKVWRLICEDLGFEFIPSDPSKLSLDFSLQ